LFLLDHATVLEHMLPVEAAAALGRRAGVRVWTFWDDLCQLRTTYPAAWTVLLNGTGAVQVFGSSDYLYAAEAGAVLGIDHRELLLLDTDEQIVRTANGVLRLKKLDVPADH
jgi:type IV secretory pathway TraG/TraD family ATPase VirD4